MDKFFIPELDLGNAQHAIVSKFHVGPALDISDIFRLGLGYYEEEVLYPNDESQHNLTTNEWFVSHNVRSVTRHVRTILWHLLPFLRKQASYAGLYISEHTDWSQWVAYYDHRRQGTWLYMPEMPAEQLEAIEIFESFGEFPT
jgi:hypothetical protein